MREIVLHNGKVAFVDDEDFSKVSSFKWYFNNGYARARWREDGRERSIYMHRLVLGVKGFAIVDHINRNPLDNRKANLRLATKAQNSWNRRAPCTNASGYKGVSFSKASQKWAAEIKLNGRKFFVGLYATAEHAAIAADAAAVVLQKQFASPNFPENHNLAEVKEIA